MRLLEILLLALFISAASIRPLSSNKKARVDEGKKRVNESSSKAKSKSAKDRVRKSTPPSHVKKKSDMSPEEKNIIDFEKKCKIAVPNNFSPSQAEEFCSGVGNQESLSCAKDSRSGNVKLTFTELIALCQGATTNYPLECFKVLSAKDRKNYGLELCRDATTSLPSTCFKRITTIPGLVRKVDPIETLFFCKEVASHTQLDCVYTGLKKKRMSFAKSISECQHPHEELIRTEEELFSATGVHVDDTAFGFCMSSVSGMADWSPSDADMLCGQAGSMEHVTTILRCVMDVLKLKEMTIFDTARVCRSAGWVEEQSDTSGSGANPTTPSSLSPQRGQVASCVHKAFKEITTSSSARTVPDVELVIAACHAVRTPSTGTCIASFSNKKMRDTITPAALLNLCSSRKGLSMLSCLKMQQSLRPTKSQGPITPGEVLACSSMASHVHTLRIIQFESSLAENPQIIMAGRFFSMTFEMIDQWGDVMGGTGEDSIRVVVEVERSHLNDPGAVLYGARTNTSEDGRIIFRHLMVSQPGPIQLKITMKQNDETPRLLFKFLVQVSDNPEMEISHRCLFVFGAIQSPFGLSQAETAAWNDVSATTVVGRVPSTRLFEVLSCLPVFASWAVTVHISSLVSTTSGPIIEVLYRSGIEAVWTGHGMPRAEMPSHERLGIPVDCTNLKQIRGAYYKKSLKWHPDRWSSIFKSIGRSGDGRGDSTPAMVAERAAATAEDQLQEGPVALYQLAVQEAFELVAEAYEELVSSLDKSSDELIK